MSAAHAPITPEINHLSVKERIGRGVGSLACGVVAYSLRDKVDFPLNLADVVEGATTLLGAALAGQTLSGRVLPRLAPGDHPEA